MIANRLNVYRDMYQLFMLLASIKTKMNKEFRSTLGERMLTAALDALDCIQRANMYKEDRAKHLVKFVEHFERMKMLVRASFELRAIDGLRRQAEISRKCESIGRQISAWKAKSSTKHTA